MAAGPTTFLCDAILNLLLCGTAWPVTATTLYVSLHTDDPGETGTNEVTASEYVRQPVARSVTAWNGPVDAPGGGRQCTSVGSVTWPNPTTNWGTITHIGMWDSQAGGNLLWVYQLPSPVTVTAGGNPFAIADGQLRTIVRKGV